MANPEFLPYLTRKYRKRKIVNKLMIGVLAAACLITLAPLLSILGYVIQQGAPALNWAFLTELPKPVGELGGGLAHAVVGTLILVFLASGVGIPWGVMIGIFLAEYPRSRWSGWVKLSVNLLSGIPSIIIGLFVYALLVVPMKRFSALAGGLALGILMIPTISRTVEELLKLVPQHIREAGLALGIPRWKVILQIVLTGSVKAIMTGIMLSVARVAGETAPLLFTAFGNRFWQSRVDEPIASLPIQVYQYAISPYEDWHRQAWAGALLLLILVFGMNLTTRIIVQSQKRTYR
jgi:phosphate transport system permease protein